MSFSDIFKKSFLEDFVRTDIGLKTIVLAVGFTCLFALYIFFVYRIMTRKTFYDKNFNISLAAISVIVCAIILTIQSSIVISLGMVGALSIVRFRTAIKNPMDLVFLFWSISVGIICGASLPVIAFIMSGAITVGIIILEMLPVAKAPVLLVINASSADERETILNKVKENTSSFTVKSQTIEEHCLSMIIEVRVKNDSNLIKSVTSVENVTRCSLVSHDGEVTF